MIIFYINGKKQLLQIVNTVTCKNNIKMPIKKKNHNNNKNEKIIINKKAKNHNKIIINRNLTINNHYIERKKEKNKKKERNKSNKSKNLLTINSTTKNQSKYPLSLNSEKFSNNQKKLNNKKKSKFMLFNKKKNNNTILNSKLTFRYNDIELNSLKYQDAIIYDKRTYSQYYCSLLKLKHLILFTFMSKIDYNLLVIKLSLFIFSLSLYFTVNTLFFNDTTLHKIYEAQGETQFIYSILNIFYSTLISSTITLVLKLLALSNKNILKLKTFKSRKKAVEESLILVRKFTIKFNIYFIISLIFLLFFWYLVSAFCAVYSNSQILLFQNTLSSFAISLIYPFGLYLLPGIFRISALRAKNKDKECLYTFSNLISLI